MSDQFAGFLYQVLFLVLVVLPLFVFLPLAFFRASRPVAVIGFMFTSAMWALVLWLHSAGIVYETWGMAAVTFSALALGVGTILAALIAAAVDRSAEDVLLQGTLIAFVAVLILWTIVLRRRSTKPDLR